MSNPNISQAAESKTKLVKDEKPTNRSNSKGRFFVGMPGFFKGKKHTEASKRSGKILNIEQKC